MIKSKKLILINIDIIYNISKELSMEPLNKNTTICTAPRKPNEPHLRCLMKTKNNEKYCRMHMIQQNIIDYIPISEQEDQEKTVIEENNTIIKKMCLNNQKGSTTVVAINRPIIFSEQKINTIENLHQENEDELEIKLLILINDDQICNEIRNLIGPVFDDVTISEDDQDSVTLDIIWTSGLNGKRIPAKINKFYLFSYLDTKGKVRCLTIFTIYDMIQNNNLIHPIIMEPIPENDINRAKKLINIYSQKIDLFNKRNSENLSSEFELKNRITRLFKKFEINSIYFETSWVTSLTSIRSLKKISSETDKMFKDSIMYINKEMSRSLTHPKYLKILNLKPASNSVIDYQNWLAEKWEKIMEISEDPKNQTPIWIIAKVLSMFVPEVVQKYQYLDLMV